MMKKYCLIFISFFLAMASNAQGFQKDLDSLKIVFRGEVLQQYYQQSSTSSDYLKILDEATSNMPDDTLKQLAQIAIFSNLYGYKWVSDKKMTQWLRQVEKNAIAPQIKHMASATYSYYVDGIVGQRLNTIVLPGMDEDSISTDSFKGKFLVIDLWATWCGPCIQEMKNINKLRVKYPQAEFYSISFDRDFDRVQKFVKGRGYEWPIVFAGKNHPIWQYFRVGALPNYFIVDPEGNIVINTIHSVEENLAKAIRKYE